MSDSSEDNSQTRLGRVRSFVNENPITTILLTAVIVICLVIVVMSAQVLYYQFVPAAYFYQVNEIHACDTQPGDNEVQIYYDRTIRKSTTADVSIELERVTVVNNTTRYDQVYVQRYPGVSLTKGQKVSIVDYPLRPGLAPGMYRFEVAVNMRLSEGVMKTQVFTTDKFAVTSPGGPGNRSAAAASNRQC